MNCDDAKTRLRERFDAGLPLDEPLSGHVETCLACWRYRVRLEALNRCLAELPYEVPEPGFARRVRAGIAEDARRRRLVDRLVWGGAVAAGAAAAAVVGWLYPLELQPRAWWRAAVASIPDLHLSEAWQSASAGAVEMLRTAQNGLHVPAEYLPTVPPALAWSSAAAVVLLLLFFNVFEAHEGGRETNGGR